MLPAFPEANKTFYDYRASYIIWQMWSVSRQKGKATQRLYLDWKVLTSSPSIAEHNVLIHCRLCVYICMCGPFRKRLDRKLICISISDTAWSRPPRRDPRGAQEMTLFVEKKIMKMRTENGEGEEGIKLNVSIAKKADWWQVLLHGREQQHMTPLLIHILAHWVRILKILPKFLWITSVLLPKKKIISAVVKADCWLHLYPVHTQIMALVIFCLKKECSDCPWFTETGPYQMSLTAPSHSQSLQTKWPSYHQKVACCESLRGEEEQ